MQCVVKMCFEQLSTKNGYHTMIMVINLDYFIDCLQHYMVQVVHIIASRKSRFHLWAHTVDAGKEKQL